MSPKLPDMKTYGLWQAPLVIGLVILWLLLWDQVTVLTLVTGIVLALAVTRVFYLPPAELSGRVNLWYLIVFFVRLTIDIVIASIQVAWLAFRPGPNPESAVIGIDLHSRSDLIMTWTAEAISVVPGSVVVEADRENHRLYLHAINVRGAADIDRVRRDAVAKERRLTMAIGSKEDVARIVAEATRADAAGTTSSGGVS
jgi:multicomponent Na+:H+ antiporter subunit E